MKRYALLFVLLLLLSGALAEGLTLKVSGEITGFAENKVTVVAPVAGTITLTITDEYGTYRSFSRDVMRGTTTLRWDGLGDNEERLRTGTYTLRGVLDARGTLYETSIKVKVGKAAQSLIFALPGADTLYLQDNSWFCEVRLTRAGTVCMDVYRAEDLNQEVGQVKKSVADTEKVRWDGKIKGRALEPGAYVLRYYAQEAPERSVDIALTIAEGKAPTLPVAVTGPVLAQRGMTDAEIWAIMQKPSVVADLKEQTSHLTFRAEKSSKSAALGTLHGQSQGMEVHAIEGNWALVSAWNHESGEFVKGYVPLDELKVVTPSGEFGLLIDKAAQTLTVYQRGERIAELPVSTGLAGKDRLIRETAAGAFLTVDRISTFKDEDGYEYAYAIRYDGGNLLHQLGYRARGTKRDFTDHEPLLGQKASHGCVRLPRQGDAETGINAYWLWTHLPYGTRVMILDDPKERQLQAAAVSEKVTVTPTDPVSPPPLEEGEREIVLTLGGDVVLGTREYWWNDLAALPAYLDQEGLGYPFSALTDIFAADDMTFVNLESVLKDDKSGENTSKEWRFRGLTAWTETLKLASIEQVSIANNHYIDYGTKGRDSTRAALEEAGIAYSGYEYVYTADIDGTRIGFGGCRETVYLEDPFVIQRDMNRLRAAGCDVIVYTLHGGVEYAPNHNALQQEMAYRAAAAGADIVLGGHPHVVQGITHVGGSLVMYSLGNLMFGGTHEMQTFDGMLAQVRLRFRGESYVGCTVELMPVLTSSRASEGVNDFRPVIAEGEDRDRILQKVQADTPFVLKEQMYFPAE